MNCTILTQCERRDISNANMDQLRDLALHRIEIKFNKPRSFCKNSERNLAVEGPERDRRGTRGGQYLMIAAHLELAPLSRSGMFIGTTENVLAIPTIDGEQTPHGATSPHAGSTQNTSVADLTNGKDRIQRKLAAILAADVAGYSRLMSRDEHGTMRTLAAYRQLMDDLIAQHGGRVANTAGDSVLAEFPSIFDAVECSVSIQLKLGEVAAGLSNDAALRFRMGIHLGDVMVRGNDLLGDGVNIAARLEGIAEPGGVCISGVVFEQIDGKIDLSFRSLGIQSLKNIARPIEAYAIELNKEERLPPDHSPASGMFQQEIKYCRSEDGVRLAYSLAGSGPPLVKSANWINHLELDWELPLYRHTLTGLAKHHTLIRYDARGNGLSDWDSSELSIDAWVNDLEAVVDAVGLQRFPIFGFSQGCAVSIAYAVRNPHRVSRLILFGGFATGRYNRASTTPADLERFRAVATLMRFGWNSEDPTFRQMMTSQLMPTATKEQAQAFNEMQRKSLSAENAARHYETVCGFDIRDLLPHVSVPTLILHIRDDLMVPIDESRRMAAGIPGARFVSLPGKNHIPLENDPGMPQFFEEISNFLHKEDA
jgi:class 3 adenylate cyclase/pimeloyl-ACP methyl ester carboxylesterase